MVLALFLVRRISGNPAWARRRFAFAAGALSFLIMLATILEIAGPRGMGAVAAAFAAGLVPLHRRRIPEDDGAPGAPEGSKAGA